MRGADGAIVSLDIGVLLGVAWLDVFKSKHRASQPKSSRSR
jgi:hypothetical protein